MEWVTKFNGLSCWIFVGTKISQYKSSHLEVFLGKGVLKICSKFTGERPCQSVISIELQSNFTEIKLGHGCSLVNLLHLFSTSLYKNTSGRLLLLVEGQIWKKNWSLRNMSDKLTKP